MSCSSQPALTSHLRLKTPHWHRVQRPWEKINHALVFLGAQGIGKDTLLEPVKDAIGPWNFAEVNPMQALGRFNSFLKSVILRISEARDVGDYDRYSFYDHSSPHRLMCCGWMRSICASIQYRT